MEYNQFKQLLQLKGIREKETIPLLENFIAKFPYCQSSQLLLSKALHDQDNIHYDQQLKLAAAYAPNREVLHDLIGMKPEETEFEFPLSKKITSPAVEEQVAATPSFEKEERERFEEWYSEDEISGRAFEEQKEKEKHVDPHALIKHRLSEILGENNRQPQVKDQPTAVTSEYNIPAETVKQDESTHTSEASEKQNSIFEPVEEDAIQKNASSKKVIPVQEPIPDPVVATVADEVDDKAVVAEEKTKAESHAAFDKSAEEKVIMAEAAKARDVLDTLGLEHAMEESILDSLEKRPMLVPDPVVTTKSETPSPAKQPERFSDLTSPRSFTAWLKTVGTKSAAGFEEVHASEITLESQAQAVTIDEHDQESELSDDELIEKFLLEDPKIVPSKSEFYSPVSQAKKSVMDHDDVVSETLAQIYLRQGNTQKARWCYEKLMLLHPEKSAFFAALLKEIDDQTNNKEDL